MNNELDKEALLSEYSDKIGNIVAKVYGKVQKKYYEFDTNESGNPDMEYFYKLQILEELIAELDRAFPDYMDTCSVLEREGIIVENIGFY